MTTNTEWGQLSRHIRSGNVAALEALFEHHGVDPNIQDHRGSSLLHRAVHHGSKKVIEMLLGREEVNVNTPDIRGRTPLCEAARLGSRVVVEIFLNNGRVDLDARDRYGQTPLSVAVMEHGCISKSTTVKWHEIVVELLLASGRVDPDAKDKSGLTPLAWASRSSRSIRIAKMLLNTGRVDANCKDKLGITHLMWTVTSRNDEVKELLLNSGKLDEGLETNIGSSNINPQYVTHWMQSCDAQHGEQCKPACLEHRLPQQLPHWVIDISRECLVPGNTVSRYVALSYVWSQGSIKTLDDTRPLDSILLKNRNLLDFQTPGYLKNVWTRLPTAVKDAMPLVRGLGENYLWVDCLCIVQDDEKTREQVDHMGDIYSGAHLTIIAATPWGSREGLHSPFYESIRDRKVEDLYDDLYRSTRASRGWTFQEQMLSRRAVVFIHNCMFWECQQAVWSPDGPTPETAAAESASFKSPHYEKFNRMLTSCYPDFDLYTEMISLYNSRVFTYPQDVLPAFSGVLTTLGKNFPSGFQYGLPRVHLDIALLWQPFRKADRRERSNQDSGTPAPKAQLPSWSWCGWTCPVDPYHLRARSSHLNQDDRTSQSPIWRTQKLVQWYTLPEDTHCQVPADKPFISVDEAPMGKENNISLSISATQIGDSNCYATRSAANVQSARQETNSSSLLGPVPLGASPQYVPQPHDTWPFLSCQTTCLSLRIKTVHDSLPTTLQLSMNARPSIFELPQFANAPTQKGICDLICLENQAGLSAGTLRHMKKDGLKPGDAVDLIAISTGTVNPTGIEGDEGYKLYSLVMDTFVSSGPIYAETSEDLGQYNEPASIPCDTELIVH